MTNDRTTVDSVSVVPAVRGQAAVAESSKPVIDIKVIALSIDENDDFGTVKGKANIRKVAKKNSENAMWYVAGSTTPFGEVANSVSVMRSNGLDGYEVHMLAEVGIQLQDPTSCGEMIMRLN